MYSLKEIRTFQENECNRIKKLGEKVHPKLFKRLNFFDFNTGNIDGADCDKKYNELILPELRKYRKEVRRMINEHLHDFIEGWVITHPEMRWAIRKNDGAVVYNVPYDLYGDFDDYIIDLELNDYCQLVLEMVSDFNPQPFWTYSYYLTGNGFKEYIYAYDNAVQYLNKGKDKFKGFKNDYAVLEKIATDSISLPFKMKLPEMGNEMAYAIRNDSLQRSIKHHKVLHAFFENFGDDQSMMEFSSYEDENGVIKFSKTDID